MILESCASIYVHDYKKDVEKVGRAKQRTTDIIRSLEKMPYNERLKEINILSLSKEAEEVQESTSDKGLFI